MALHITVAALKGGVGKSTVVLNVATCLHRAGHRVLVIDADRQGTCRAWAEVAAEAGHAGPPVVALAGAALRRDLPTLAAGYDVLVIDSPPYAGPEARSAMLSADLVVLPTTPGAADAWALQATLDVLAEVRGLRPELRAAMLLNRADRTRLTKAVREAMGAMGLAVLGVELGTRVTFGEATLAGQGVVDYAPSSPAAAEVQALTHALLTALREPSHAQDPSDQKPRSQGNPSRPARTNPRARRRRQGAGPSQGSPQARSRR